MKSRFILGIACALAVLFLSACPNQLMRDLVEQKLTSPAASTFIINSGAPTASRTVTLNSSVTKANDALEMRFKNESGDWSAWQPYTAAAPWTLSVRDGAKTVHAEYRDEGHHVVAMTNTIVLNTGAPGGDFYVWGTAISGNQHLYVNSTSMTLCMNIINVAEMRFSNDNITWSTWQPFADSTAWSMSAGDGNRTLYAEFRTNAMVVTPASCAINLDTTAPVASGFQINGGAATATSTSASLGYSYSEANALWAQYMNDGESWSAQEALAGSPVTKAWALRALTGDRAVSLRLSDIAGNVSTVYSDSIYLSTAAPGAPLVSVAATSYTPRPTWSWAAIAGATQYRVQLDSTAWVNIGDVLAWTPGSDLSDGNHTLSVQSGDVANNWSASGNATTLVDTSFALNIGVTPVVGGTTTPGNTTAAVGVPVAINASPDVGAGYHFVNWQVIAGSGVSFANASSASTTVTLTAGDATIQAVFALNTYTVSVTYTGAGWTSSSGTATHGVPFAINAAPDGGWAFVGWTVQAGTGVSIANPAAASTTVTLTNVNASILATFSNTVYVSPVGSPANSGLLPSAPKSTIADGIAAAAATGIQEVRVSVGTYIEAVDVSVAGLRLKGSYSAGFAGRAYWSDISRADPTYWTSIQSSTSPVVNLSGAGSLIEGFIINAPTGDYALQCGTDTIARNNTIIGSPSAANCRTVVLGTNCSLYYNRILAGAASTYGMAIWGPSGVNAGVVAHNTIIGVNKSRTVYLDSSNAFFYNNTFNVGGPSGYAFYLEDYSAPTIINNIFHNAYCAVFEYPDTSPHYTGAKVLQNNVFSACTYYYYDFNYSAQNGSMINGLAVLIDNVDVGGPLGSLSSWGNVAVDLGPYFIGNDGLVPSATTPVNVRAGGQDLSGLLPNPYASDKNAAPRTSSYNGGSGAPTNVGAGGWSMGAYEQDN